MSKDQTDFTTKYIIEADFTIKGVVEKSDIVGAIFGQTEGLLLDLDLRDLQKSGRIGRIEVENESQEGVSKGTIKVPSSLTRKETALLAATIETVSRVGPCEAEIKLIDISDVRETKRQQIIERAAALLKEWDSKSMESSEMEEKMDAEIKLDDITEWGPEKLPAGPDLEDSSDIIIVEGRADVLNLLRIGVTNTIAVQGTQVPKSVIELTKRKKSVVCFLDGDRGGDIILNELLQVAKIDFIARAPDGYEVEELTRKQLIKSLQNKRPVNERNGGDNADNGKGKGYKGKELALFKTLKKVKVKDEKVIMNAIKSVLAFNSIGFNSQLEKLFEMPTKELFDKIKTYSDLKYLIIDGILTNRLLSLSINMKIQFIACKNKEDDLRIPDHITVFFY